MERNFPFLKKCRLSVGTFLDSKWGGCSRDEILIGNGDNTISARWSRSTSLPINHLTVCALDVMWLACTLDVTWWKWYFTFVVFLPKTHSPSLLMGKTPDKFQQGVFYKNTWHALLKIAKVTKNKEILLRGAWQNMKLNVMWHLGGILEQKRSIR